MEFHRHTSEDDEDEELEDAEETGTQPTSENSDRIIGGRGGHRYGECLKNHAVGIGKQAVDGCREFMAAGEEGTLEALKCAACNCHRNFHRKVPVHPQPTTYYYHHHMRPAGYLHVSTPPLALPAASRDNLEDQISNPSSSGGGGGSKKRFRTKFTDYQKERMLPFAEGLGWRIQKDDEAAVQQFCNEIGIKRKVLKVWMHNNKHTLERDDDEEELVRKTCEACKLKVL